MFVSLERLASKLSVQIVSRTDDDEIDIGVVKHFFGARNRIRKPESLANVVRRNS
jgi:hypothetical protein